MKRSTTHILSPGPTQYWWGVAFLLMSLAVTAQQHGRHHGDGPAVKVKVSLDKQEIVIGQPVHMLIEAFVPGSMSLTWPALDSLPHFEWVEKGKLDSVGKPDEQYYRQYFTITSFDSGVWAIPQLPFYSDNNKYLSDTVMLRVNYSKFDPNKDYHDIKDIIDIPNPYAKWIPWGVGAVTLIALALVVWLVMKKKLLRRMEAAPLVILTPYEEAVRQLEELHKQGAGADGQIKIYYTRLNDILRLFVLRRLGIASLAETNEELIGQLRRLPLTHPQFDALAETLRMTDFVKFAKYQPGAEDNERSYQVIRQSVDHLNEIAEPEQPGQPGQGPGRAGQTTGQAPGKPEQTGQKAGKPNQPGKTDKGDAEDGKMNQQ
ncbi:MAG TPA: hypothetical protein VHD83_10865 [Puia sp.]|nr:hypothetical protein [Puia sp.]